MGHTTNKVTLKHYLTACEKRDAEMFWRIKLGQVPCLVGWLMRLVKGG